MHLRVYLTVLALLPRSWAFLDDILSASKIARSASQPSSNLVSLGCLNFPADTAIVSSFDSDSLTFEGCLDFCISKSQNYFGVTKGHTCVCMDSAFTGLPKVPKENCVTGCTGNLYEQSGNDGYIQAFSASSKSLVRSLTSSPRGQSLHTDHVSSLLTFQDSKISSRHLPAELRPRGRLGGPPTKVTALGMLIQSLSPRAYLMALIIS